MGNDELLNKLGKRIAQLRKEKGYRQIDLADKAEMEEFALRRIEIGGTNPTFKTLVKIAKGLDMSIKDLLDFN